MMLRPTQSIFAIWKCPSCTVNNTPALRTFATSLQRLETRPESPRYIDIPEPPQQTFPHRSRVKGVLPIPRDIFNPRRGGLGKVTPEYLESATKQAKPTEPASSAAERSQNDWKQRMTDRRKQNFREGLLDLQSRRQTTVATMAARTQRRQAQRERLLAKAEREDERLTNPTTTLLMKTSTHGVLPDPNREERLAKMRANVAAKQAQRMEERRYDLHTLYMHARDFITTESALDKQIEVVFQEMPPSFHGQSSIWGARAPESIKAMLDRVNRAGNTQEDTDWVAAALKSRVTQIAEQLTGGKT